MKKKAIILQLEALCFVVSLLFFLCVCTFCVRIENSVGIVHVAHEQSELFIHCFQNHFLSATVEEPKGAYKCGVNVYKDNGNKYEINAVGCLWTATETFADV